MTGEDVAREALTWLGVPWRHQGRDRNGVDCGGLVHVVGRALGLLGPGGDMKGYLALPEPDVLASVCRKHLETKTGPVRDGDVVLILPPSAAWPSHLGIVATLDGVQVLVHSHGTVGGGGSVKASRYSTWASRVVAKYQYRGLAG